jgi:hypothetical protein
MERCPSCGQVFMSRAFPAHRVDRGNGNITCADAASPEWSADFLARDRRVTLRSCAGAGLKTPGNRGKTLEFAFSPLIRSGTPSYMVTMPAG